MDIRDFIDGIKKDKYKIGVLFGGILITTLLFSKVVFPRQQNIIKENQSQIILKQNELTEAKQLAELYKNQPQDSNVNLEVFEKKLPSRSKEEEFIANLEKISRSSNVVISSISPLQDLSSTIKSKNYKKYTMEIVAVGSFPGVLSFVHNTSRLERFNSIESIKFSVTDGLINAKISFAIFST